MVYRDAPARELDGVSARMSKPGKLTSISPRERQLRETERRQPHVPPSLLEELFQLLESGGPLKINFDDLCGLAGHIPDLRLPIDYQLHNCGLCVVAKSSPVSLPDCVRNKHAVNRLLTRRREGFAGQCHLGLTDIVEPLLLDGRVLGTFFFGSVVVRGTESRGRKRIREYCRRRQLDPKPLLIEFDRVPRVPRESVPVLRDRLRSVVRLTARLVEAWGFPSGSERPGAEGAIWHEDKRLPALLRQAMRHCVNQFADPLDLNACARALDVNADYLGGLFRNHLGLTFGDYLARVRVNHARRLLETGRFRAGEAAHRTGFADQAHFGKVFKRLTGQTPAAYAASHALRATSS